MSSSLLQHMSGYQFIEKYEWLPALGISLHFGVDGISAPLVLLTGVVMFTGVLISWGEKNDHVEAGIQDRPREFFAFLFILASGVFGVFASLDLFMLFFFYEIAVFPMYLLIVIWGWIVTREYAAMKLTLYLFLGSVVSLVGALVMYWQAGRRWAPTRSTCCNWSKPTSRWHSRTPGSFRCSSASRCWAASGRSTTGRLTATSRHRLRFRCSTQAC
jgi:NADH:ubiquinone oxidoreductase subunit 4 (subunit M)